MAHEGGLTGKPPKWKKNSNGDEHAFQSSTERNQEQKPNNETTPVTNEQFEHL